MPQILDLQESLYKFAWTQVRPGEQFLLVRVDTGLAALDETGTVGCLMAMSLGSRNY
jgi:hypothetical protein